MSKTISSMEKVNESIDVDSESKDVDSESSTTIGCDVLRADYDPYTHRDMKNATSNFVAYVHLLAGMIGTGILAVPKGFNLAGYVTGTICMMFSGALLAYCLHILIRSQNILCRRYQLSTVRYERAMALALKDGPPILRPFAPFADVISNCFILAQQLGFCAIYTIFMAQNLKAGLDETWNIDVRWYIVIFLLPLIGLACIRNLKLMAPFSIFNNIAIILGMLIILVHAFTDTPHISTIEPFGSITELPVTIGIVIFALICVNVATSIECNMKTPKSFVSKCGTINSAFATAVVLFILIGFMGSLKYGENTNDIITLNLPAGQLSTQLVQAFLAFAVLTSCGLQLYVANDIIWGYLSKHFEKQYRGEMIVRSSTAIFIFILSISFQNLRLFISLIGAICSSMLAVTFPALMEICVLYPKIELYVLIRNMIIAMCGVGALILGVIHSIANLMILFM